MAREALIQTTAGAVVGTWPMSPGQARGLATDARTDIWSFGCVLYEMLAGRPAFGRATPSDTIAAVLEHEPDWRVLPGTVPADVRWLLEGCLTKGLEARLDDVARVRAGLEAVQAGDRTRPIRRAWGATRRRPRHAVLAATVVLALAGLGAWWWMRAAGPRWARDVALPEIARLVEKDDNYHAFLLARKAQPHLPGDSALHRFFVDYTFPHDRDEAFRRQCPDEALPRVDAPWEPLGRTL